MENKDLAEYTYEYILIRRNKLRSEIDELKRMIGLRESQIKALEVVDDIFRVDEPFYVEVFDKAIAANRRPHRMKGLSISCIEIIRKKTEHTNGVGVVEVTEALLENGWVTKSKNPPSTIFSTFDRD